MTTTAGWERGKRRKSGSSWASWLPLVLGILLTPFALRAASILALSCVGGLMLLYPFVQIVQNPTLHFPGAFADPLAQWIMYLQFPIYGLLMTRTIKSKGFWIALNMVVLIHAVGIGVAYLLARYQNPYLRL